MSFSGSSSAHMPPITEVDRLRMENASLKDSQKRLQDDVFLWNKTAMTWQQQNSGLLSNQSRIEKERNDYRDALLKHSSTEHDRLRKLHERETFISQLKETNKKLYQDNTKLVGSMKLMEPRPDAQTALRLSETETANKALYEDNMNLKQYNERLKATIESSRDASLFNQLSMSHQHAVNQNTMYLAQIQKLKADYEELQRQYAHVVNQILTLQQKGLLRVTGNGVPAQVIQHSQPSQIAGVPTPNSIPFQQPAHPQLVNVPSVPPNQPPSGPQTVVVQHPILALQRQQPLPPQAIAHAILAPPQAQIAAPPAQPTLQNQIIRIQHASPPPFSQPQIVQHEQALPPSPIQVDIPTTPTPQNCANSPQTISLPLPQAPAPPPAAVVLEGGGPSAEVHEPTYSSLTHALSPVTSETGNRDAGDPPAQAPPTPPRSFKSMSPEESISGWTSIKRNSLPGESRLDGLDGREEEDRRKRARLSDEDVDGTQKHKRVEGEGLNASKEVNGAGVSVIAADSHQEEVQEPVVSTVEEEIGEILSAEEGRDADEEMRVDAQEETTKEEDEEEEEEIALERDPETGLYREEEVIVHLFEEDDDHDNILYCPFCRNKERETGIKARKFIDAPTGDLVRHYKELHLFALEKVCREGLEILQQAS